MPEIDALPISTYQKMINSAFNMGSWFNGGEFKFESAADEAQRQEDIYDYFVEQGLLKGD